MTTNNRVIRFDAHAGRACTCGVHVDAPTKPKREAPAIRPRNTLPVDANDERRALEDLKRRQREAWRETTTE